MNKQYLKYLFKSKKGTVTFIGIFYTLLYITTVITANGSNKSLIGLLAAGVILGILSYLIIPIMFNYVHNKKAVDSYFCLPISRKEMLTTTLIFSIFIVNVPFVILSFVSLILMAVGTSAVSYIAFLMVMVLAVIASIVLILFNTTLYLEANSIFDGIVLIFAYGLLPFIFILVVETFKNSFILGYSLMDSFSIESYLSMPYSLIVTLFKIEPMLTLETETVIPDLSAFGICALWHLIVSFIGLYKNFIERKMERAETVSNNFFSYPFVRYAYVSMLILITTFSNYGNAIQSYLIIYALLFIAFVISYFVYKRKIKIMLKDVIFFVCVIALSFVISFITYKTEGFGVPYKYEKENINSTFSYYSYNWNDAIYKDGNEEIEKIINDKYKDYYAYSIYFDLNINPDNINNTQEALDTINNYRDRSIKYYYQNYGNVNSAVSHNQLDVHDNLNKYRTKYEYNFISNLSYEELSTVNKYSDVMIEINCEETHYELTLDELLSKD